MPRGRTKELLHTARFDTASSRGRQRICRGDRKNHEIRPGDRYLAVKDGLGDKSYCLLCAHAVLALAKKRLDTLLAEMDAAAPASKDD